MLRFVLVGMCETGFYFIIAQIYRSNLHKYTKNEVFDKKSNFSHLKHCLHSDTNAAKCLISLDII